VLNETMLEGEMVEQRNKQIRRGVKVQDMKLEKEELELAKEIKELKKPPAPEPPKTKTTRGRSPKQKRREEVLTKYDNEMARIDRMKKSDKAKATLRKAAEAEKEKEMAEIENMP
jgi:hypothetical protein